MKKKQSQGKEREIMECVKESYLYSFPHHPKAISSAESKLPMNLHNFSNMPKCITIRNLNDNSYLLRIKTGMIILNIFINLTAFIGCGIMVYGVYRTFLRFQNEIMVKNTLIGIAVLGLFAIIGSIGFTFVGKKLLKTLFGEIVMSIGPKKIDIKERFFSKIKSFTVRIDSTEKLCLTLNNSRAVFEDSCDPDHWDLMLHDRNGQKLFFTRDDKNVSTWLGKFLSEYYKIPFKEDLGPTIA